MSSEITSKEPIISSSLPSTPPPDTARPGENTLSPSTAEESPSEEDSDEDVLINIGASCTSFISLPTPSPSSRQTPPRDDALASAFLAGPNINVESSFYAVTDMSSEPTPIPTINNSTDPFDDLNLKCTDTEQSAPTTSASVNTSKPSPSASPHKGGLGTPRTDSDHEESESVYADADSMPSSGSSPPTVTSIPLAFPLPPAFKPQSLPTVSLPKAPLPPVARLSPPLPLPVQPALQVEPPQLPPNVYINGLPPNFPEDQLFAMCSPFGAVKSVRTFTRHVGDRPSGYGFVLFEALDSAERCIESLRQYRNLHPSFSKQVHKIPGTSYALPHAESDSLDRSFPSGSSTASGDGGESFKAKMERLHDRTSTNLYFEGLPLSIDEPTLASLVHPYTIKSSRFFQTKLSHPPRIIAFVRLETRTAAEEIIERLHGRMVRGWNDPGSRISVRFADTSEQRELRRSERTVPDGEQSPSRLTIAQAALINLRGQEHLRPNAKTQAHVPASSAKSISNPAARHIVPENPEAEADIAELIASLRGGGPFGEGYSGEVNYGARAEAAAIAAAAMHRERAAAVAGRERPQIQAENGFTRVEELILEAHMRASGSSAGISQQSQRYVPPSAMAHRAPPSSYQPPNDPWTRQDIYNSNARQQSLDYEPFTLQQVTRADTNTNALARPSALSSHSSPLRPSHRIQSSMSVQKKPVTTHIPYHLRDHGHIHSNSHLYNHIDHSSIIVEHDADEYQHNNHSNYILARPSDDEHNIHNIKTHAKSHESTRFIRRPARIFAPEASSELLGHASPPVVSPALTYSSARTPSTLSPATPFFGGGFPHGGEAFENGASKLRSG